MAEIKAGFSLNQLFDKSAGPIGQEVLTGGLSVRLEAELWKNFHGTLMKALDQCPELLGVLAPLLPVYIFQI